MLREALETRLDQMFQGRGPMWGDPEAYELQVLLLLELLYFPNDPEGFARRYRRFLLSTHPFIGSSYLSAFYGHDVLATELSWFRRQLARDSGSDPAQLSEELPADPAAGKAHEDH